MQHLPCNTTMLMPSKLVATHAEQMLATGSNVFAKSLCMFWAGGLQQCLHCSQHAIVGVPDRH